MLPIIDAQFVIGLVSGGLITLVYVACLAVRFYHPIIRAQHMQVMKADDGKDDETD